MTIGDELPEPTVVSGPTFRGQVLRLDAVRWAIDTLTSRRVHPFFIAYLHIRARGLATRNTSQISPRWAELGRYLAVPGGPPGKPYYRPFLADRVHDRSRYWMNENLAGSWAPSSLREGQAPLEVVDRVGQSFSLKAGHARLARHHLLFDEPMPVMALATYLYRNYGFADEDPPTSPSAVITSFVKDFQLGEIASVRSISPVTGEVVGQERIGRSTTSATADTDDEDFEVLFSTDIPSRPDGWFEEFRPSSGAL